MSELKFVSWDKYWDKKEMVDIPGRGTFNVYSTNVDSPWIMICIHGAGHSALSFSLLAESLRETCSVIAPDLKCHGETGGNPAIDLSIENLTDDCVEICKYFKKDDKKLLLMGHSLGGCITARASKVIKPKGLFVIDTVEGIATASMPKMHYLLQSRPASFKSEQDVIHYIGSSGEMNNYQSAAVSAPGRIMKQGDKYVWRTDILPSEPFWNNWFKGFAQLFINAPTYKVIILPNVDRLDTPFTIGHMSGKFQLEIVHGTNHCMQEDRPDDIAAIVKRLIERLGQDINIKEEVKKAADEVYEEIKGKTQYAMDKIGIQGSINDKLKSLNSHPVIKKITDFLLKCMNLGIGLFDGLYEILPLNEMTNLLWTGYNYSAPKRIKNQQEIEDYLKSRKQ